jgi:glycosyltransferase involved in cell wall biosynthesis
LATETQAAALVLAPEAPYPLAGGGALRTASLLHYLARRYAVDLIVFRQPGAPDPKAALPPGLVRHPVVIDLPANSRGFAARVVRNAARVARQVPPLIDRFAGFERQVKEAIGGRAYQVGIVEHFWCAPYLEAIAAACRRTVLDLHNIESVLHDRCARVEGAAGLAHRVFSEAARAMERTWLPRYGLVLTVSEADAETVAALAPAANVDVYPNAIPWTPAPLHLEEDTVIFSGNLEYHPNVQAVRFFHRAIWPLLRRRWPELTWRLIGKNGDFVRPIVGSDPRIEIRGDIPEAVPELARAKVAVVPLLAGSGTRLKILEAWAAAIPVVSTRLGAEGLPARAGEHLLLADSPAAFAEAVSRLLACRELREGLGKAGRCLLEQQFTWETAWLNLDI